MSDVDELDPDLRALVDEARPRGGMPDHVGERVLGRIEATLGLAPAIPGPAPTPPMASAPASSVAVRPAFLRGALLGLGIGVVVGAVGHGLLARAPIPPASAPEAPYAPSVAPASAPIAAASPSPAVDPAVVPAAVAVEPREPHAPSHRTAAPEDPSGDGAHGGLGAERALLDIARTALSRGHATAALEALSRHAARFPAGQLTEERESLWIQVLVTSGRFDDARQRAQRFRRRYPDSLLLPAVDETLRSIP